MIRSLLAVTVAVITVHAVAAQDIAGELLTARTALRSGDAAGAMKAAETLLQIDGDDPRAIMMAADVYLRCDRPEQSIPLYDRYIKAYPESMPQLWQRGIALYFAGKPRLGAEQFVKHREVNPHDVENAAWHFLCVARAESFDKANQSVLPAPNDPRIPMAEVQQMLATGETQPVIKRMGQVPTDSPDHASAMFYGNFYLGLYADARGDHQTALEKMSLAAKDAPHHYMGDIARVYANHLRESARARSE